MHESPGYFSPAARALVPSLEVTPTVLFAVPAADRQQFSGDKFTRLFAHTMDDVVRLIATHVPRLVVLDADAAVLDAQRVCELGSRISETRLLAAVTDPARVPALIRAGAHAILLKPFTPSLLAGRMGRTLRETTRVRGQQQAGPTRAWPGTPCPKCSTDGASSFDFFSHRRMWYACLTCDNTWLGRRQE